MEKRGGNKLAAILLAGLLFGCAQQPLVFNRPGATNEALEQDVAECRYQINLAMASTPTSPMLGRAMGQGYNQSARETEILKQYLTAKGWRQQ